MPSKARNPSSSDAARPKAARENSYKLIFVGTDHADAIDLLYASSARCCPFGWKYSRSEVAAMVSSVEVEAIRSFT